MDRCILIVEDDLETKFILARLMAQIDSSLQVVWATTVEEAVLRLETNEISLVLADWRLEYGTGIDVWEICKRKKPRVGFVLMSAYPFIPNPHMNEAPLFLKKPFSLVECQKKIRQGLMGEIL
jgi:DNA-binding NtrC family response regulator